MNTKKLKTFFSNKPTRNFIITALAILAYLGLFLRPKIIELFHLLPEISRLNTKILKVEKEWLNLNTLKEKITQLDRKLDYYEKSLPSEKDIPAVLEYLSNSAKGLDVKIIEIKPIEQSETGTNENLIYYCVPILLKAECGYHQLGRFINKLENADRFMRISDIRVRTASRAGKNSIHNVELVILTYVMRQNAPR